MTSDAIDRNETQLFTDRQKLMRLFAWVSAHPCVTDMDSASERVLRALDNLSAHVHQPAIEAQAIEPIAELLNQLIDTIGNCKTEERNLKSALWSEIVLRAEAARNSLQAE